MGHPCPTPRRPQRHRIAAALALLPLTSAFLIAPTLGGSTAPGSVASSAPAAGTTVPAPGAGAAATVSVSSTADLVNQTVTVSWSGFRPSSGTRLDNAGDSVDINTENPVRVYQCRGSDPASSSECYGSPGFRGVEASDSQPAIPAVPSYRYPGQDDEYDAVPDGPANFQDTVTAGNGTGEVNLQVFTRREAVSLGCDDTHACSIVVVPNYGRPQGATEDLMDAPWAWDRRTVVPLDFQPLETSCSQGLDALSIEGSPTAARALASWRGRTCTLATDPVGLDYTAIGEQQTRGDVADDLVDVGLVIDPLAKEQATGIVYAPTTITGLVVAFQIDDAHGRPVRNLKLNARLVAKLVTASYRAGANAATLGNPVNIFRDKEFLALNPGVDWPGGAPGNHPLLLGDISDTTVALTRWLSADPDARAFLAGAPDPWGMKVNTNYADYAVPFDSFPLLDQNQTSTYQPIQGLDAVARQLSIAQFPGFITQLEGEVTTTVKPPRQNPGRREVIGIIDAASAANFRLSAAALQNGAGKYVEPDQAGFLAGIAASKPNADGVTRQVDHASKNPAAYPLTLLVSSALPVTAEKPVRAAMARYLDYVAGDGQVEGTAVGDLPEGHAPLTTALLAQVTAARAAVLKGAVPEAPTKPGGSTGGGVGGTVGGGGTAAGGVDAAPVTPPAAAPGDAKPGAAVDPVDLASAPLTIKPVPASRDWMLPVFGLIGLLLLLTGPLLMVLSGTKGAPAWLRR